MNASDSDHPKNTTARHDEAESFSKSPPADNPVADSFNIVVSVPESIQIKMVDASALADYEIWIFISSILSNAVVGFLVAYFQAVDSKSSSATYVGWTDAVFALLFVAATLTAVLKRTSLRKKGRDIRLKTSGASAK